MHKSLTVAVMALAICSVSFAQDSAAPAPSPGEIVAQAAAEEWVPIAAEDLLVMTLAPDAQGNRREVIIQLMPPPFSEGWVHNIRLLAREGWYDGTSVNRVQDNYVVQWGDPNYDNPEADGEAKPLPEGLKVMGEEDYTISFRDLSLVWEGDGSGMHGDVGAVIKPHGEDSYAQITGFEKGWPIAGYGDGRVTATHCYGMVGVGRNYSPDTGSGAELYTVIGHAPRHLDRNIALVGRIISGMEHLSSLPRGKGELGFYADFEKDKRTPIISVRVASDLLASSSEAVGQKTTPSSSEAVGRKYTFEYLSTESRSFARYADARANRRDRFFIHPAGGADICNIPVPVRRVADD